MWKHTNCCEKRLPPVESQLYLIINTDFVTHREAARLIDGEVVKRFRLDHPVRAAGSLDSPARPPVRVS